MKIIFDSNDAIDLVRRPEVAALVQRLEKMADESIAHPCSFYTGETVLELYFKAFNRSNDDVIEPMAENKIMVVDGIPVPV
jgi:hypothetical protein